MELIPNSEVFQEDKRNTKKMMLPTDAVCVKCGIIFNSVYEDSCLICDEPEIIENKKEIEQDIEKELAKHVIRIIEENEENIQEEEICDHTDFIVGRQSVDLRILLDFHVEDLRALCEIHGCSEGGSRGRMVVNIMKQLYSNLDKRIDERLIRKMIIRNRKRFRFWKDIECAINRAKKSRRIELVDANDVMEITELGKNKKVDKKKIKK